MKTVTRDSILKKRRMLITALRTWICDTFPERQIYIRSEGRVQFFSFGPILQAVMAMACVAFFGWVAFASVNVIFKDRIIAAKEKHFQTMQAAYENRVADLEHSYDEVNSALVASDDRFRGVASELQAKQNTILRYLGATQQDDAALSAMGAAKRAKNAPNMKKKVSQKAAAPDIEKLTHSNALSKLPPQQHRIEKTGMMQRDSIGRLADAVFGHDKKPSTFIRAETMKHHPALHTLARETARVQAIGASETRLMARAGDVAGNGIHQIDHLIRRTGMNPQKFAAYLDKHRDIGGPDIPIDTKREIGVSDPHFRNAYLKASLRLNQLETLLTGMGHVPLVMPVWGKQFVFTSGFGPRIDPFTHKVSFHPGMDFAGPRGAIVRATAPGTVVKAQYSTSYGNFVEIDHGLGLHTKYGHLMALLVKPGQKVRKGDPIGKLGSTGRSTGPHVHYEVRYYGVARNPRNFIEAGRYVLKQG